MEGDDAWVRDLWPRAYALAYRMLGNAPDAQDAAQDAFVRAIERFETYRGEAGRDHWVLRITTRVCLDVLEKRRRRGPAVDWEALPAREPVPETVPVRDRLGLCLQDLPPQQKAAFVLRDIEGLAFETVAEMLGCSPGTARVHLMKARLGLRESWLRRFGERPQ